MSNGNRLDDDSPTWEWHRDTAVDVKPCWAQFERECTKTYPIDWGVVKRYAVLGTGVQAMHPGPPPPPGGERRRRKPRLQQEARAGLGIAVLGGMVVPAPRRHSAEPALVDCDDESPAVSVRAPRPAPAPRPPGLQAPRPAAPRPEPSPSGPAGARAAMPHTSTARAPARLGTIESIPPAPPLSRLRVLASVFCGLVTGTFAPLLFVASLLLLALDRPGVMTETGVCVAAGLSGWLAATAARGSMGVRGLQAGVFYTVVIGIGVLWGTGLAAIARVLVLDGSVGTVSSTARLLDLTDSVTAPLAGIAAAELLFAILIAQHRGSRDGAPELTREHDLRHGQQQEGARAQ